MKIQVYYCLECKQETEFKLEDTQERRVFKAKCLNCGWKWFVISP